ncbi:MAG: Ger(x)C family spore germination C-terminal domain-containing protein [Clostridia bacterium]
MKAKFCFILALIVLSFSLQGCIQEMTIEENGYVIMLGVDKGEKLKYNFTFVMQNESAQSENRLSPNIVTVSTEGEDIFGSIAVAESALPYNLDFSRMSVLVFSSDIAKSTFFHEFFLITFSSIKVRESADMLICAGKSADFLNGLKSDESISLAHMQYSLFDLHSKEGRMMPCSMMRFLEGARGSRFDAIIPFCAVDKSIETEKDKENGESSESDGTTSGVKRKGGMKSYVDGSVIFSGFKEVGVIDANDTKITLIALGELKKCNMSVPFEGMDLILNLNEKHQPKVKFSDNGMPTVEIEMGLEANIEKSTAIRIHRNNDDDNIELIKKIESTIAEYLESELIRVFEIQKTLNSDFMGIGRYACMTFKSVELWEAYNFREKLKILSAQFSVDVELLEFSSSSYAG